MQLSRRYAAPTTRRIVGIVTVVLGLVLTLSVQHAGSQTSCGEYSFGFTGTRLINDGISNSAGPFTIDLPAGTYDIMMVSNDNHPTADYQTDQTAEQWFFQLSNGYTSPFTDDIPNDAEDVTNTVKAVALDAANSISVHHRGEGGVNSVNVICVGFTTVETEVTTPTEPAVSSSIEPEVESETTIATETTEARSTTDTEAPEEAVTPSSTTIEPEVQGEVEVSRELAFTGPSALTTQLTILGVALVAVGLLTVHQGRRRET